MLRVTKAEYEEMLAMLDSSSETSLLSLDKMVRQLEEEDTLQKTRDTLLPNLLSGELDVSELELDHVTH